MIDHRLQIIEPQIVKGNIGNAFTGGKSGPVAFDVGVGDGGKFFLGSPEINFPESQFQCFAIDGVIVVACQNLQCFGSGRSVAQNLIMLDSFSSDVIDVPACSDACRVGSSSVAGEFDNSAVSIW